MNRPHFLVVLLLAFLVVLVTFFLPPFSLPFSDSQEESSGVEHGWPVAWATSPTYAEIPIIGPLLFWMTPDSITFHLYGFLFDVGFWFSVLWLVSAMLSRRDEHG